MDNNDQKRCICKMCPTYVECGEPLAYCLPQYGSSKCITVKSGCVCQGAQYMKKRVLPGNTIAFPAMKSLQYEYEGGLGMKFAETADVLVVGSGAPAFSAAITASTHGAEVLMLEKGPIIGGTTLRSGGDTGFPIIVFKKNWALATLKRMPCAIWCAVPTHSSTILKTPGWGCRKMSLP